MARSGHSDPDIGHLTRFRPCGGRPGDTLEARQAIISDRRTAMGSTIMWDTVETSSKHLSHDLPCSACGHGVHSYLPCSDTCHCTQGRVLSAV
ncbi:hypothetical protein NOZE110980_08990 [Nocardioides zeicaulis]